MPDTASPSPEARPAIGRLRFTNRSVVLAVVLLGFTVVALGVFAASTRVLGWVVVAALGAGLLYPPMTRLARQVPRGLAVAVVFLGTLAGLAGMIYLGVDDVRRQADRLEQVAPEAAQRIEESERFGEAAREFELADKVQTFVDELPARLVGGEGAAALRAAATRGVAFLATGVLTLFLLVHGSRLVEGGLAQVRDEGRRERLRNILTRAYQRSTRYLALTIVRCIAAGVFTWFVAKAVDLPGATLLGIGAALTSLVPDLGVLIGSVPVLLLTGAFDPSSTIWVALAFVAYQAFEIVVVQPRLDRASFHVGPVVSLVALMLGFELYGIGGMLTLLPVVVLVAAVVAELAPSAESDLLQAADEVLAGDDVTTTPQTEQ